MSQIKVLFVCMGNICRSPTAEGVFISLLKAKGTSDKFLIDSAGTHAYHVGKPPDHRAQDEALLRGVDLSYQRARQAEPKDFHQFDYILAMDRDNYRGLAAICPEGMEDRLHLFLDFARELEEDEVPDPYYGGKDGFRLVFEMVESAAAGLLESVRLRLGE